jgi:hypothetical protein
MIRTFLFLAFALFFSTPDMTTQSPSPILVELFTSEGCSSCPPADRLLQQIDQSQPVAGAQIIVLSEHVDYWNSIGWKDPYSAEFFSKRQGAYASHFGSSGVYTPQMVVDGTAEFVGSDSNLANRAMEKARSTAKILVHLSSMTVDKGTLHAHVLAAASPKPADVFFVIAFSHAESQVSRGENSGRHLTHVAVVQQLEKIGSLEPGKEFAKDVELKLPPGADPSNLRAIAFVQEPGPGRVLGATLEHLQKSKS